MSSKEDTRNTLQRLLLVSTVVFTLLAVSAVVFMNNASYQLTLGHLAKDALASGDGTSVLVPANRVLFDFPLKYLVAFIMGISAIYMLLTATRWSGRYDNDLKTNVRPPRWVYLAITTALMVQTIALLSGVNDLLVLKVLGGLIVISKLLDLYAESLNKGAKKPAATGYVFVLSVILGAMPWIVIAASAVGTTVYGLERMAWYVYALYAAGIIASVALAKNLARQLRRSGQWKDYGFVERNYLTIDFLSKTAFAIILIVGLKK